MRVTRITVGESDPGTCLGIKSLEFCVELAEPIEIGNLEALIGAESEIRLRLRQVLGTDSESLRARQDIQSLWRKLEMLTRLTESARKRFNTAKEKWEAASSLLKTHGIDPNDWDIKFPSVQTPNSPSEQVPDSPA